jgi:nicotinamide-nucleotide amidase
MVAMDELLDEIAALLTAQQLKIATAESCTGGLIGHTLTNVPGSSIYYVGGVIAYTNALKTRLLKVNPTTLDQYGAVSEPTAREMAQGIQALTDADIGIATTGIAGPGGGTSEKPVGLVYVGLAAADTTVTSFLFDGGRLANKQATVKAALQMIRDHLRYDHD